MDEEIDRVRECGRCEVIVFRRDEHVGVGLIDVRRPRLGVILSIGALGRMIRLVEYRQFEVVDVDQFGVERAVRLGRGVKPFGDGWPTRPGRVLPIMT